MTIYKVPLVSQIQFKHVKGNLSRYSVCVGVDYKVKVMDAAGPDGKSKRVKVTIWDTGTLTPVTVNQALLI